MIKITATANDGQGKLVGLGLSYRNLELLKAGKPIVVKLGEMLPGVVADEIEVLIFAGEDEYTLTEQLASMIGPQTRIGGDPTIPRADP